MRLIRSLAAMALAFAPLHAAAQTVVSETVEVIDDDGGNDRAIFEGAPAVPQGVARFGPFRVLDGGRAALVDATSSDAPAQFAAMLRAYPGIATLEMIECPGTYDDVANLQLGRAIHARGLVTHVPAGGSVRSGAVELYLAGAVHRADPGAEFAVHSWEDDNGKQAVDFPADAPVNRAYLDYYREMGMTAATAARFYAMTNSVPNASARWLTAAEMDGWAGQNVPPASAATLASLDSNAALK